MLGPSRILGPVAFVGLLVGGCGRADATADHGPLTTPYLQIAARLAADSTEGLSKPAAQVTEAARAQSQAPGMAAVLDGAERVAATELPEARTAFKILSDGLIEHLRQTPDAHKGLMLVHCPMTFDSKGALWVQPIGKVANPYEGSRMLQCGSKIGWGDPLPET